MNRLPESFLNEGLKLAETTTLFGIQIESLTRDELIAAVAIGWKKYHEMLARDYYTLRA